jgi:hypothetical protein
VRASTIAHGRAKPSAENILLQQRKAPHDAMRTRTTFYESIPCETQPRLSRADFCPFMADLSPMELGNFMTVVLTFFA